MLYGKHASAQKYLQSLVALQIWGGFVTYFCEGCSSWKFTKCMKNMQPESSEKLNSPICLGDLDWGRSDSTATI